MPDAPTFTLFMVASLVLLVVPGPAVLYIVTRSIDQGTRAGLVSTLGISCGTLFHVAAAALGVSALLVSSALAFNLVRYVGAAYLIYLGVRRLLDREEAVQPTRVESATESRLFVQGVLVNLLNPKTALFFLAFLPQFVDVRHGSVALQMTLFGAVFIVLGLLSDGAWALFAGSVGGWLRGNLRFVRLQRHLSGGVLIALGLATAVSGRQGTK